jgi:predicted RNA-binding protein with PIN domain
MRIAIDAYNVIHQDADSKSQARVGLANARERLIKNLVSFNEKRGHQIYCVFDGREGLNRQETRITVGSVTVIYSAIGESADDVIKALAQGEGANLLVVTSDREIAQHVEQQGGVVLSSPEFTRILALPRTGEHDYLPPEEEDEKLSVKKTNKKKGPARRLSDREKKIRLALEKL